MNIQNPYIELDSVDKNFHSISPHRLSLDLRHYENDKYYKVNKGTEHTEIEVDESPTILVSIQTYELNDVIDKQVHCVIKGNQE